MTTRAQIIAEARTWIGTPWVHQGRLKGIACDCVGMIICVARALEIFPPELDATYSRNPQPKLMIDYLNQYLDRIDGPPQPADVLLLRPHRITQHLGILTGDNTFIHAIDRHRGVREHILDPRWQRAICGVWRYRGIQ